MFKGEIKTYTAEARVSTVCTLHAEGLSLADDSASRNFLFWIEKHSMFILSPKSDDVEL
jgi:hypothetical protein